MGLKFDDVEAWREWQARRHLLRWAKGRLRPSSPAPPPVLLLGGGDPRLLVAVDAPSPTITAALREPLALLPRGDVGVLTPAEMSDAFVSEGFTRAPGNALAEIAPRAVAGIGDHLPVGAAALAVARRVGVPFLVVQHGLLTPFAPPPPRDAHLLAWSDADASFWADHRRDVVTTVVGSVLLARAASQPRPERPDGPPVFLGQLHAAELARGPLTASTIAFCRRTGATYRPHPAEHDRLSRLTHQALTRLGVRVDSAASPLSDATSVVSAFSTGVLEAAALGIPSWVYLDAPPRWLREFWDRYGMRPWGGAPTAPLHQPSATPAEDTARELSRQAGLGRR